jgi:hypothetical protein
MFLHTNFQRCWFSQQDLPNIFFVFISQSKLYSKQMKTKLVTFLFDLLCCLIKCHSTQFTIEFSCLISRTDFFFNKQDFYFFELWVSVEHDKKDSSQSCSLQIATHFVRSENHLFSITPSASNKFNCLTFTFTTKNDITRWRKIFDSHKFVSFVGRSKMTLKPFFGGGVTVLWLHYLC